MSSEKLDTLAPRLEERTPMSDAVLRDLFASHALTGILASEGDDTGFASFMAARRAYEIADAMLDARKGAE